MHAHTYEYKHTYIQSLYKSDEEHGGIKSTQQQKKKTNKMKFQPEQPEQQQCQQ